MGKYIRRLVVLMAMFFSLAGTVCGQQTDREQLLNLFHKANVAKDANDINAAIDAYLEIVELSPALPEPYLHLADLYAAAQDDTSSVEKALSYYSKYLELKPDADDMEEIRAKMDALYKNRTGVVAPAQTVMVSDTAAVDLHGKWVSAETAENRAEVWIIDIEQSDSTLSVRLNENSYILKTDERFAEVSKVGMDAVKQGGTLSFRFSVNVGKLPDFMDVKGAAIIYNYEFRLAYEGFRLNGSLSKQLVERTTADQILKEEITPCEFYLAPDDYVGFSYMPLSEELKATNTNLVEIFDKTVLEIESGSSASNDLGYMYEFGIGTYKNMMLAVAYYNDAITKDNLFAKLNMARLYQYGIGVEKDTEKAQELYDQAYKSGYTDAMVLCGDIYLEGVAEPLYSNALACYQKAAIVRCPDAYYRLGLFYKEGFGVEVDFFKSWDYYQKAIKASHVEAITDAGIFYRDGIMVKQDYVKALEYLEDAASKGHARAMFELSDMYLRGIGVEQDFKTSRDWLYRAMKADDMLTEGFCNLKSNINSILNEQE